MKKIFCLILSVIMAVGSMPITVYATAANNSEFDSQLSDMLNKYQDDYYSEITIDVENNTLKVDDDDEVDLSQYDIDYSKISTDEMVIPAVPVLEAAGYNASFDDETNQVVVVDDNNEEQSYSFYEDEKIDSSEIISSQVDDGVETVITEDGSYEIPVAYFNEEQAQDEFNLDAEYDNGIITITNQYQSKRLVVQTKNNQVLSDTYDAVEVINDSGYYVLQYDTEQDAKNAYEKFNKSSIVKQVSCDKVVAASAISDRSASEAIDADAYKEYLAQNNKTTTVTVAVLDTGAETTHELLKGRLVTGYDAYSNSTSVSDGHGHGTHVSGIVVDNTPSNVKVMPIKVLQDNGSGTELAIKQGIEYAVSKKVNVINMSLGGSCSDDNCIISKALKAAVKAGITVVVAAGNDSKDCANTCPARISECITVAAYYTYGSMCSFSNYGDSVDLCAPGYEIESSYLNNSYEKMSGTSMATPFASAAAAMVIANNTSLKPSAVCKKLQSTCADMFFDGWDKYSGAGLINFAIELEGNVKPATSISLSPAELEMNYFGNSAWYKSSVSLSASNNKTSYDCTDYTFTAENSDESVVEFDGMYYIPKGAGSAKITVSIDNGKKSISTVKVNKIEVWTDYAAKSYGGGNGTKKSPYLIYNAEQLAKIAKDVRDGKYTEGQYFKLMADIDLSGKYWISIADIEYNDDFISGAISLYSISINLDGNNHKISNMTAFDDPMKSAWSDSHVVNAEWYQGNGALFYGIENSEIKNLGIENAYSTNGSGILTEVIFGGTKIDSCYTSGYCSGNGFAGSIVNADNKISNCYSSASVGGSGFASYVLAPSRTDVITTISNSFFCGEQLGNDGCYTYGGFVDTIESVGESRPAKIYSCFSSAVTLSQIGFTENNINAVISKCYYLDENSKGISSNSGDATTDLKAKSLSFFKTKSSFTTASNWNKSYNWDFNNVWAIDSKINNGYPYLKNNVPTEKQNIVTNTWLDYAAQKYDGGSGTKENPFLISTAEQLAKVAYVYRYGGGSDTYFKLTADIDLSAHEWLPIGGGDYLTTTESDNNNKYYFFGNIDGDGHTISGLNISTTGDYIGFIAKSDCATVQNINFTDVNIKGNNYVGSVIALASYNNKIVNCSVTGSVAGNKYVGAIAGFANSGSQILGCSSTADVTGSASFAGICGESYGTIQQCSYVGSSTGGLVNKGCCTIKDCYSIGSKITQSTYNEILTSYAIYNNKYCYYQNYLKLNSSKTYSSTEFKNQSAFVDCDFDNVWTIDSDVNNGYPTLKKYNYVDNKPTENWYDYSASSFKSGNGTKGSPYIVSTAGQLVLMIKEIYNNTSSRVEKYFSIVNDIDLAGKVWYSQAYNNSFDVRNIYIDGNGHTISNVYLDNACGFLGFANYGIIANLNLESVSGTSVAGLLGMNEGVIKNCSVTGEISNAIAFDSKKSSFVGGITGDNYGTIERCSFNGTVEGGSNTAGIAGYSNGTIRNCYASGKVRSKLGKGICSTNSNEIENCYVNARIISSHNSPVANYNYSNCYYSYTDTRCGNVNYTVEQMQTESTYSGWDFENVWAIDEGSYPYFRPVEERKITYVLNGGKLADGTPKTYYDGIGISIPNPTKTGGKFAGWYLDSAFTQKVDSNLGTSDCGDITLYAKWTAVFYVSYNGNGSTSGSMSKQTVERNKSTALTANKFKRTGYTFSGWATSKDGNVVYKDKTSVKNIASTGKTITLYAKWKANTYTVKFVGNGGTGKMSNQKYTYDVKAKLNANKFKAPRGCVFGGWSTSDGATPKYTDKQNVSNITSANGKTVTLYAYWVSTGTYKITYKVNGGKMPSSYAKTYSAGKGCTLPKPTRKGYTFDGWYTNKECTKGKTTVIKPWVGGNKTYYAKWKKK